GSDGGLARYRLILEPWTALLRLRRNAVIFQDQDTRAICEQIFTDYPQAVFRFDVQAELQSGALVEVLPQHVAHPLPVTLLQPHRQHRAHRVQVFIEWLL
ncbi:contractile injection system protein, VgrG/Pvc8 family, partial [Lactobacillus delbrueckii]|uniref:contractile injection system protein, VgrG/Pvc8 family n=1 Tax=Lactobacillus delbrueckii TaxID=1584 RepID=UPI0025B03902